MNSCHTREATLPQLRALRARGARSSPVLLESHEVLFGALQSGRRQRIRCRTVRRRCEAKCGRYVRRTPKETITWRAHAFEEAFSNAQTYQ
eukprot:6188543-Pleurochrysis_carterae.AAC.11